MAAPNATVYKCELQVTDMDRHYYASHNLTLAQHPSETELRLMARLLMKAMAMRKMLSMKNCTVGRPIDKKWWSGDAKGTNYSGGGASRRGAPIGPPIGPLPTPGLRPASTCLPRCSRADPTPLPPPAQDDQARADAPRGGRG